ncbi:hypothetical protein ROZALSC1DRAFT_25978, partial [Rozella allomycis CSF55]
MRACFMMLRLCFDPCKTGRTKIWSATSGALTLSPQTIKNSNLSGGGGAGHHETGPDELMHTKMTQSTVSQYVADLRIRVLRVEACLGEDAKLPERETVTAFINGLPKFVRREVVLQ